MGSTLQTFDMIVLRMKSLVLMICAILLTMMANQASCDEVEATTETGQGELLFMISSVITLVADQALGTPVENEIGHGVLSRRASPCPSSCYWNSRFKKCMYEYGSGR